MDDILVHVNDIDEKVQAAKEILSSYRSRTKVKRSYLSIRLMSTETIIRLSPFVAGNNASFRAIELLLDYHSGAAGDPSDSDAETRAIVEQELVVLLILLQHDSFGEALHPWRQIDEFCYWMREQGMFDDFDVSNLSESKEKMVLGCHLSWRLFSLIPSPADGYWLGSNYAVISPLEAEIRSRGYTSIDEIAILMEASSKPLSSGIL